MLILTRRVGETIVIGDDVIVTVLGIKGNQVRIGINAPKDVTVHREEIYQRIQQEKNTTVAPATTPPSSVTSTGSGETTTITIKKRKEKENKDLQKDDKEE